jgi:hypothetical protein
MIRPRKTAAGGATIKGQSDMNDMTGFNKESVDGLFSATRAAAKGMEAIKDEMETFSKLQFKDGMAALNAVRAAKSVNEAMDLQLKFVRSFFDAYMQQTRKLGELSFNLMQQNLTQSQEAFAPINAHLQATIGKMAKPLAA